MFDWGYMQSRLPHNYHKRAYKNILGKKFYVKTGADRFIPIAVMLGMALGCAALPKVYQLVSPSLVFAPVVNAQELVTPGVRGEVRTDSLALVATPSASPKQEVMQYIIEVFGDDADRAIWVAKCESGLRTNALNDKNRNGTVDHGVFQINSVHTKRFGSEFKTDWKENVRVARKIQQEQGFKPWVCAKSINEKNYLNK